jgi:hypothetical protein
MKTRAPFTEEIWGSCLSSSLCRKKYISNIDSCITQIKIIQAYIFADANLPVKEFKKL